jgi:DNA-directed RNA polymerase beta subunit
MPHQREGSNEWKLMPHERRMGDMTYYAPIQVEIEYTVKGRIQRVRDLTIGYMPMMLGGNNCWLKYMSHEDMA